MIKKRVILVLLVARALHADGYVDFNWGLDFNYARYTVGELAPQSGYLAGPHVDFQFKKPRRIYLGLNADARWNAGLICSAINACPDDTCITGAGSQAKAADYITDAEIGYFFVNDEGSLTVKPYTGLGFYHLSYQITPDILRYKYYQFYVPVGLEMLYHSERSFSIGGKVEYRAGALTKLRVTTPCVTDDCDSCCDEKMKLNYSQGFHIEMPVIGSFRNDRPVGFYLSLSPFFDWNRFADTCEKNSQCLQFPIPVNTRWYLGVMANLGISF